MGAPDIRTMEGMAPILRYGLSAFFVLLGGAMVVGGLMGQHFYFKPLGSKQRGPSMPVWMARPFFVALGSAFLYAAFSLFRNI